MKEALSTFNATVKRNTPQPIPKEDDDCDLYAKLLATKLRKLPEEKKLRFMHDIDGMYMQYILNPHHQYQHRHHSHNMPVNLFYHANHLTININRDLEPRHLHIPSRSFITHQIQILIFSRMTSFTHQLFTFLIQTLVQK